MPARASTEATGIPSLPTPDSTLTFLRDGYLFGTKRFRRLGTDVFRTRIIGRPVTVARGREAARLFYEGDHFGREGALPTSVVHLLQDEGSVQSLTGVAHRHRKHLFLRLLVDDERLRALRELFAEELLAAVCTWPSRLVLHDELVPVLTRTALRWAGIDPADVDVDKRASELAAMVGNAGRFGPRNWIARLRRRSAESWAEGLIEQVRSGQVKIADDSPLAVLAFYTDETASRLNAADAAIELLNLLRPTVAVGRFIVFSALALHSYPSCKEALTVSRDANDENEQLEKFANEVRRFYPFFPVIGGTALKAFKWNGYAFWPGDWVLLDLYGTNHDERLWPEPNRFRPERFTGWDGDPNTLIPQGAGEAEKGHRCPGERATVELMKEATSLLCRQLIYTLPDQDLRVSLRQFPALPESGFVMQNVEARALPSVSRAI